MTDNTTRKTVIVESPFRAKDKFERLKFSTYASECVLDCLDRGEAPFASHMFYTSWLDDAKTDERALGMEAGWAWTAKADSVVVYQDCGISEGMRQGIERAEALGVPVYYRSLPRWTEECECWEGE